MLNTKFSIQFAVIENELYFLFLVWFIGTDLLLPLIHKCNETIFRRTSNISRTLVGNIIVEQSNVVVFGGPYIKGLTVLLVALWFAVV